MGNLKRSLGWAAGLLLVGVLILVWNWVRFSPPRVTWTTPPSTSVDGAVVEKLAGALRIPTLSESPDRTRFLRLHRYLKEQFPRVHSQLSLRVMDGSLLFWWEGTRPTLKPGLLLGHLDVVPITPGTEKKWKHPPFSGKVADGAVWGRGAVDDKAGVVTILEAVEQLIEEGFRPERSLYLAFGHDEETGGTRGAGALAAEIEKAHPSLEWVLDEGGIVTLGRVADPAQAVAFVGIAEKGYLTLEFTVEGRGGHSSMPPSQTVIGKLAELALAIENHPLPPRLTLPALSLLETLGPHLSGLQRFAIANRWVLEPLLVRSLAKNPATNASIRTTTALTQVGGGNAENVLPGQAKLVANFRLIPGDDAAFVLRYLEPFIPKGVTVKTLKYNPPSPVSDPRSLAFSALDAVIQETYGPVIVAPYLTLGGTDTKHYQHLSSQVFRFLPALLPAGETSRIHGTDERIELESLGRMVRFYRLWITRSTGGSG